MNSDSKDTLYTRVKDADGEDLVCPYEAIGDGGHIREAYLNDCMEPDVIGRYAGQIKIV